MLIYVKNPKDSTKSKKLKEMNKFYKFSGYKINKRKSVVFLYTNNALPEEGIKKTIPFTVVTKRIKYLRTNLTKKAEDLYTDY